MGLFQSRPAMELAKLRDQRATLEARVRAVDEELRSLRSASSEEKLDAFLAGAELGVNRARIASLEGELEDLGGARPALTGRIRDALLALARGEAEKKRTEATKKQGELAKHLEERNALLRQAAELEAAEPERFIPRPAILVAMPVPLPWNRPAGVPLRSEVLAAEIQALKREADSIEQEAREQAAGGRVVNAETIDELIAGAAAHPLGPSAQEIRAWQGRAAAAAEAAWAQKQGAWQPAVDRVTRFSIIWNGAGVIDEARSEWANSHISRPIREMPARRPVDPSTLVPRGWYRSA